MNPTYSERRLDAANGRFSSVVTWLDMPASAAPAVVPEPPRTGVRAERWPAPDLDAYLDLFRRIGGRWLWHGRLTEGRDGMADTIRADTYEVWRLIEDETPIGLGELDRSRAGEVELVYFGLLPERIGGGLGGWFLRTLLHRAAAADGVRRIWLHTCTEDHPDALGVYRRFGFREYARDTEWVDDPRLRGLLPREAGPHVPIPE